MARSTSRWRPAAVMLPAATYGRCHGSLATITDSERRTLRPIGTSAYEVASRTGVLLACLLAQPGVRIFQGVRPTASPGLPRIPHAVSSGRRLILVESVAWPPGCYTTAAGGLVYCDDTYIGQSVRPLIEAVRYWRHVLPHRHQVSAVVVVHTIAEGNLMLPLAIAADLVWARAGDAADDIRARLPRRRLGSPRAVAALTAAATE